MVVEGRVEAGWEEEARVGEGWEGAGKGAREEGAEVREGEGKEGAEVQECSQSRSMIRPCL